ncbi:MAG: hypothetical protein KAH23_00410 [Kiritimatiellae bacterium]|nr:hypothetical protein [Kiritimatiellia bacterium]
MSLGESDYHVHYFVDGCVNEEMTLVNIEKEALRLGLEEICVLKHYSQELPNGEASWMFWNRIIPEQFVAFIEDIRGYQVSSGISMLAGVETEIVNDSGRVNIPAKDADSLDALILSVHWLPHMSVIDMDPDLIPGDFDKSPPDAVARWHDKVQECGVELIVKSFVSSYVQAIVHNPKVRVLAHMFDGLLPLRRYEVPVDDFSSKELDLLMEPLMVACAENEVLWELTPEPVRRPSILKKANDLGVRFTATADAHFLQTDGWANLREHSKAEEYISSLGLTRGSIILER